MKTMLRSAGIALLAVVMSAPAASAETAKCERAIAKAGSQFLQARVKALSKCNEGVVKAGVGTCPDDKANASIAKAASKLETTIAKSCGGADKTCGSTPPNDNEDSPASVGWPSVCPNFEKGACNNVINDCSGIATCIECISDAASDQSIDLSFGDIVLQTSDKALNKCQATIGKANAALLNSISKALQKCWDARIKGKHSLDCFPPSAGDGKYQAAIDKAKNKASAAICKACGGADKACGGGDDFTPAQIGFASDCIYVTRPHDLVDCSGPISTLQDIVDCTSCANQFKGHCMDDMQVPQYSPYPPVCNSCTAVPPSGPCPSTISFTADGTNADLDTGFTGLAHHARIPTQGRITLAVSGCAGGSQPTCGQCNVSGPLENGGGETFSNHRCKDTPWVQCTSDSDCTNAEICIGGTNNQALCTDNSECPGGTCQNAGYAGPCIFYFGSPLPLVAGGVSTCILNEISGPISGTIDFSDGSSFSNVPLSSKVHVFGDQVSGPCPRCTAGQCTAGARQNHACTVTGHSLEFGDVSLDCPPTNQVSTLGINLNIATGTQTKTVEAGNPTCRQNGYTGLKCLCDTCNNVNQEGCSTNADCPATTVCVGGSNDGAQCTDSSECPGGSCGSGNGICGGRRCVGGTEAGKPCNTCVGGTNHGATCSDSSSCPGGTCPTGCAGGGACTRPGEATQPNACQDDSATPGLEGCVDIGNNDGECQIGPVDTVCSIQTYKNCTVNADCDPATCPDCLPGQQCIARNRPCFTDNGIIGNAIAVSGTADTPCGGVSKPTVGTFFCIAPTSAGAVNSAGGLPSVGRVRIPGVVLIDP